MAKREILYKGEQIEDEVANVPISDSNEYWNTISLGDGTKVEHTAVPVGVFKTVNHRDEDDYPIYVVDFQCIMRVTKSKGGEAGNGTTTTKAE